MSHEKPPEPTKLIDFEERKKAILERKEKEKMEEEERKQKERELRWEKAKKDGYNFRRQEFFRWEILKFQDRTGLNMFRELESFLKKLKRENVKMIETSKVKQQQDKAEGLTDGELIGALLESGIEDWKNRPAYYKKIYELIYKALNPKTT